MLTLALLIIYDDADNDGNHHDHDDDHNDARDKGRMMIMPATRAACW